MAAARRVRRIALCALTLAGLVAPAVARAAGLDVPENGAYVIARGGTSAGLNGTAYSLMFNPAGLTGVDSWDIRIDARLVGNGVTFTRAPRATNGPQPTGLTFLPVSNSDGPSLAPSALVAYHPQGHILRQFAFAVGVFAPPGVAAYQFPDPTQLLQNPNNAATDVDQATGQRYSLIQNSNLILFPSVAVAWSPSKYFSVGITAQAAYASISFSQAIAGQSAAGFESSVGDGIAQLKVTDPFQPTFIAGVMIHPIEGLTIGASFRPQVALDATGTLEVSPPPQFQKTISQSGDTASLKLNLQPEARAGIGWDRGRWSLAGDFVYEGWGVNRKFVLDASKVNIVTCKEFAEDGSCSKSTSSALGTTIINKNWENTYSGRFGASFRAIQQTADNDFGLQVHLGTLFETNAVPSSSQDISTVTGTRVGFSTGVTLAYGDVAMTLAGLYYLPVSMDVSNNQTARTVATGPTDNPPVLINNGTYSASLWLASVGIAWTPHTSF